MTTTINSAPALYTCALMVAFFAPVSSGQNLISNGGAESGAASATGFEVVFIPDWVSTGDCTIVAYDVSAGFPSVSDPGPALPGLNFFAGGPSNAFSSASQTVDLTLQSQVIDSGQASFILSGYLGGFAAHNDQAILFASFVDGAGMQLAMSSIGPVSASDRGNSTALLLRQSAGAVPVGTREVELLLEMTRFDGIYNDGFADNLIFELVTNAPGAAYCFGASCPCGNDDPTAGCRNSAGTGSTLTASGTGSISNDSLVLSIDGVPGSKPGLILRGDNQVTLPVGDGLLCATGASQRSQVQVTSAGATTFTDFNGLGFGATANIGSPTNYQFWYRDTANTCSGAGFNFSNAWATEWTL